MKLYLPLFDLSGRVVKFKRWSPENFVKRVADPETKRAIAKYEKKWPLKKVWYVSKDERERLRSAEVWVPITSTVDTLSQGGGNPDGPLTPSPICARQEQGVPLLTRPIPEGRGELHLEHMEPVKFEDEQQARDYFARHLEFFEKGLKLYDDGERTGIEFRCGRMRIDILAVDRDGGFVVIEMKLGGHGSDRVVAQVLRYMGWVRKNLAAPGQQVRGIVLVHKVSEELKLACGEIPNVRLIEYLHSLGIMWH